MTDFTDVSGPSTTFTSPDSIAIQNPGFEDVTGSWPDHWVLVLGSAAQASAKTGEPSNAQ